MSGGVSWHSRKGVFLHSAVLSSHEAFFSHCWCYVLSAALFRLFSFIPVENHMILNPGFASGPLASQQSRRKRMRRVSWRMMFSPLSTVRFCRRGGVRKGPARAHETHVVPAAHHEVQSPVEGHRKPEDSNTPLGSHRLSGDYRSPTALPQVFLELCFAMLLFIAVACLVFLSCVFASLSG